MNPISRDSNCKAKTITIENVNSLFGNINGFKVAYMIICVSHVALKQNNVSMYLLAGLTGYIALTEIITGTYSPTVSIDEDSLIIDFYNNDCGGYTIIKLL